jgi:hypothetical protein
MTPTPWTRAQVEAWVNVEDERTTRDLLACSYSPPLLQAWVDELRASRSRLVRLAPECDDYDRLMGEVSDALGDAAWFDEDAPPSPEHGVALMDKGLAALWARRTAPESGEEECGGD